jgi:hypothetical protein
MPGPHPDDDVLADLAADVLPVAEARAVEAHVLECDRCAELLSDAERVRGLLLADDPGPVPPEVWNRIEAALTAEARHHPEARPWTPAGPTSSPPVSASPPVSRPPLAPASRADVPAGWDGPDPLDAPDRWDEDALPAFRSAGRSRADRSGAEPHPEPYAEPHPGRLRRLSGSRRDARADRRRFPSPFLLAGAAAVALVAVVGWVRLATSGDVTTSSGSAGLSGQVRDSSAFAAGTARILSSGRNYTKQDLAAQVRPLTSSEGTTTSKGEAAVPPTPPKATPQAAPRAGAAPTVAPGATLVPGATRAPGATPAPVPPVARVQNVPPDPRATDVRNPQRLAACLSALNASGETLVAVDLARYQNREAAVLVLRPPDGGYEVFVVERTCGPGDEGTLDYARLPG